MWLLLKAEGTLTSSPHFDRALVDLWTAFAATSVTHTPVAAPRSH